MFMEWVKDLCWRDDSFVWEVDEFLWEESWIYVEGMVDLYGRV